MKRILMTIMVLLLFTGSAFAQSGSLIGVGGGSIPQKVIYMGLTAATYDGDCSGACDSYDSTDAICHAEYPDSHVCAANEIGAIIAQGDEATLPVTGDCWVNAFHPGHTTTPANDCSGWSDGTFESFATIWIFDGSVGSKDASFLTFCNESKNFACCK